MELRRTGPTLEKWLDDMTKLCTHVMIVRNGQEPRIEAVTHISKEQVEFMREVWTRQYYAKQMVEVIDGAIRRNQGCVAGGKTSAAKRAGGRQ